MSGGLLLISGWNFLWSEARVSSLNPVPTFPTCVTYLLRTLRAAVRQNISEILPAL